MAVIAGYRSWYNAICVLLNELLFERLSQPGCKKSPNGQRFHSQMSRDSLARLDTRDGRNTHKQSDSREFCGAAGMGQGSIR